MPSPTRAFSDEVQPECTPTPMLSLDHPLSHAEEKKVPRPLTDEEINDVLKWMTSFPGSPTSNPLFLSSDTTFELPADFTSLQFY